MKELRERELNADLINRFTLSVLGNESVELFIWASSLTRKLTLLNITYIEKLLVDHPSSDSPLSIEHGC
jgi:hypothetical protein